MCYKYTLQSIDSWPSEVAEESLIVSSQTEQVKDLLRGFFLADLLVSVELPGNTHLLLFWSSFQQHKYKYHPRYHQTFAIVIYSCEGYGVNSQM